MSIASQIRQVKRSDAWIFAVGLLATPFCLLSDFGEGFSGKFWSFFPPIGLFLLALYFVYLPSAILLFMKGLLALPKRRVVGIYRVIGAAIVIITGLVGHAEGRTRMTLHGFLSHLKAQVPADVMQKVSKQILDGDGQSPDFASFVDEFGETNLVPAFAKTLFWSQPPRFVEVYAASNGVAGHYSMEWGGHFIGYVGVSAGPSNYVFSDKARCDWLQWKPGVYVWWRSEWGPIREERE